MKPGDVVTIVIALVLGVLFLTSGIWGLATDRVSPLDEIIGWTKCHGHSVFFAVMGIFFIIGGLTWLIRKDKQ